MMQLPFTCPHRHTSVTVHASEPLAHQNTSLLHLTASEAVCQDAARKDIEALTLFHGTTHPRCVQTAANTDDTTSGTSFAS